jgi:Zn-dependent M28 family amino/carboxypeptidase
MHPRTLALLVAVAVVVGACERGESETDRELQASGEELDEALSTITADELVEHIKVLSADSMEGRLPGTPGEEKTLRYLQGEFETLGLEPGNGESWFQEVPLVSITASPNMTLTISGGDRSRQYAYGDEMMAWTKRVTESVDVDGSEVVFVGYGIVAPEYDWNDYEGLDVKGKTVILLVNDPGFATKDTALFNGNAMTYYGRWTYKYEEAARQGAAAAFVVHETAPAAYGWDVVKSSWSGPQFDMVSEDDNMSRVKVEGWLTLETAREIFSMAGLDYEESRDRAAERDFEPVPMELEASIGVNNTIERSTSRNLLALLPGGERPEEYIIYMGHWDHLGRDTALEGDQIFNGALDNASGVAALLELAEAFSMLETRPQRSIVFMPVTAEEQGLLGSKYYGENPVYPLDKTVAAINIDGLNIYGPTRDIVVVGYGNSELDDYLRTAAQAQDREIVPDPEAEKGYFYRSDHFSLAKHGVPALYTDIGEESVEHGAEWMRAKKDEYTALHYHGPSDEYSPDWDLAGGVDDIQLWFRVGYRLANEQSFPEWREGTEFKSARDSMLARWY